jgi:hypothetical protein
MEQLEADMADMATIQDELETILYSIGDCKVRPTEDQLMNMLIGVIDLHKFRYLKMWDAYEELRKKYKIND